MNTKLNEIDINKIYDISRIILEFNDKNKKEEILIAFKSKFKSNPVTAKQIHDSFPDHKIYLNDQLSIGNRKILWFTKQITANYNFKYVWTNSSGVFLKKADGEMGIDHYHSLKILIVKEI